jgi:hypothetical protein
MLEEVRMFRGRKALVFRCVGERITLERILNIASVDVD